MRKRHNIMGESGREGGREGGSLIERGGEREEREKKRVWEERGREREGGRE